jgi:hypothetical protein
MATKAELLDRVRQARADSLAVCVRMRQRLESLVPDGAAAAEVDAALLIEHTAEADLAAAELAILTAQEANAGPGAAPRNR